ncbi:hypothetical protein DFH07DRAFT_956350 [Mycena maculata]|uniref:DUF6589 domain-containing protein n=1 Tax=Mycena maculata TaxID=230809 RepID=A0AAD7JF04_9AGAR|nr:hypothetical protein DFH07DRAFT_956350 [Mycena maculata]
MDPPTTPGLFTVRKPRSYKKIQQLDSNPTIPTVPFDHDSYRVYPSDWTPPPTLNAPDPNFSHQQLRLRAPLQLAEQKLADKFAALNTFLQDSPFNSVGDLLSILFYNRPHGSSDLRGSTHATGVARFLRGYNEVKMADILPLIYHHRCSFPAKNSPRIDERDAMFCTSGEASEIHHARPFMSTWATRLVAAEARRQILLSTKDDPADPDSRVQLRASTNGRSKTSVHVVTWNDFKNFSIKRIAERYQVKLRLPMFLSKYMAAPKVNGVFVERKRRPYPMSHVDVKRVYCRFGNAVADTTARAALQSMTDASMKKMRAETEEASSRGEVEHCICLDNVQEHEVVYEQGIGRVSRMKVGTAATKITLRGCAPKAFDAPDYYARVARKERKNMTVMSLFNDIDWEHERTTQRTHWARALIDFVSQLHPLRKPLMELFRSAPIAIRRKPDESPPHEFQPLMLNSECETSIPGMIRTVTDFDSQVGVDVEKHPDLLEYIDVNTKDEFKSGAMNGELAAAIEVWKEIWELISGESMGERLHNKLDVWALITAPNKMEGAFKKAKRSAD